MSIIKRIIKINTGKENFYNLAVEEDETYIANGIVVHNCRSQLRYVTQVDEKLDKVVPSKAIPLSKLASLDKGNNFIPKESK